MALLKRLALPFTLLILNYLTIFGALPVVAQGVLTLTNGDSITVSGSGTTGTLAGATVNNTTSTYGGVELAGSNTFTLSNGGSVGLLRANYYVGTTYFGIGDITITGGNITDSLYSTGRRLAVSGGTVSDLCEADYGNNVVTGGAFYDFIAFGSNTDISDGMFGGFGMDGGIANVGGGTINNVIILSGTLNITGGTIASFGQYGNIGGGDGSDTSIVNISGGSINTGDNYVGFANANLDLFGSFVAIDNDGNPIYGPITSGSGTIIGVLLDGEPISLNYYINVGTIEFNVGSPPVLSTPDRVVNTMTPLDANYRYSHVDLSDNPSSSVVTSSDHTNLSNDTQLCYGAVADGATKILLKYVAVSPGAVMFTEYNGVAGDSLVPLGSRSNTTATNQQISVPTKLINGQNIAYALYTVPESLDTTKEAQGYLNHAVAHDVSFTAVYTATDNSVEKAITSLTLQSPPVLLVHGLWDDKSGWNPDTGTGPRASLLSGDFDVYVLDYKNTNNAKFVVNRYMVLTYQPNNRDTYAGCKQGGLQVIFNDYRAKGIAITKADVVGHSMGGLVTREFAASPSYLNTNDFKTGKIRRFITIDTPHNGSPLATALNRVINRPDYLIGPIFPLAMSALDNSYGGAIDDLEPGSDALRSLGKTNIPCFAEAGDAAGEDSSALGSSAFNALNWLLRRLDSKQEVTLFPADDPSEIVPNDLIVAVSSQTGNLPSENYSVYKQVNHRSAKSSSEIGDHVALLLSGPLNNFDRDGFPAPIAVNKPPTPPSLHSLRNAATTNAFVTINTTTDGETYIPLSGQVFQPGDFFAVNVTPTTGETLAFVFVIAGSGQQNFGSSLIEASPFSDSYFSIPQSYLGDLPVTVLAQDTSGNICLVTAHASVQTSAALQSLTASPGSIIFTSQGNTVGLTATGTFSDGVDRDITAASFGTTYMSSNPAVATVDTSGLVTAIANGSAKITIANGTVNTVANIAVKFETPEIINVNPASAYVNTTSQISLVGSNLGGASQLDFLLNGQIDSSITASDITVSDQGTALTATVSVAANAAPGNRTIVVTTPGGQSDPLAAPDAAGFVVNSAPTLASLTFSSPVPGGTVVVATVTLSGPTPSDVVVGLSSNDPITVRVYRAVIIPAGNSSAAFSINTYRSHTTKRVTIRATMGQTVQTKDLTITGR